MNVTVQDIGTSRLDDYTFLRDVVRVGLSKGIRQNLCGIWDGRAGGMGGITINLEGPFVITCDAPGKDYGWQFLVIKEPNELC